VFDDLPDLPRRFVVFNVQGVHGSQLELGARKLANRNPEVLAPVLFHAAVLFGRSADARHPAINAESTNWG